jgi:transcriptional regulator with XRE-family HTH domain
METDALHNRLRLWRAAAGLSLDEASDLTGLSKPYLSRIERGERQPPALTKVQIARRLGVAVCDLFEVEPLEDVGP